MFAIAILPIGMGQAQLYYLVVLRVRGKRIRDGST